MKERGRDCVCAFDGVNESLRKRERGRDCECSCDKENEVEKERKKLTITHAKKGFSIAQSRYSTKP